MEEEIVWLSTVNAWSVQRSVTHAFSFLTVRWRQIPVNTHQGPRNPSVSYLFSFTSLLISTEEKKGMTRLVCILAPMKSREDGL